MKPKTLKMRTDVKIQILFPADYFNNEKPDEMYLDQMEAFKEKGFGVSTINTDDLKPSTEIYPGPARGTVVLYRGWMLSLKEYGDLVSSISEIHCSPFTSLDDYKLTHHLPNWYEHIKDLTPETVVFSQPSSSEVLPLCRIRSLSAFAEENPSVSVRQASSEK